MRGSVRLNRGRCVDHNLTSWLRLTHWSELLQLRPRARRGFEEKLSPPWPKHEPGLFRSPWQKTGARKEK